MKRLITILMLFPFLAVGQTKFSQLPTATPDTNTSVVGLKKVGGIYSDYLFSMAQMMSYINSGVRGGTLQSVTDTGNTATNTIKIGKGTGLNPYQSIVLSLLGIDSSGIVTISDTAGYNTTNITTSGSAHLFMSSSTGSPVSLSTNSGLQLGSGLPVVISNVIYADTLKCNTLTGNITDTFPATSGTLAMKSDVNSAINNLSLHAGTGATVTGSAGVWTVSATGGTVTSITAGTGLSGGTITSSGTISLPNTGTAGTYGSSTQIPSITTDAQGRVTGVSTYTFTGTTPSLSAVTAAGASTATPITITATGGYSTDLNGNNITMYNSSGNQSILTPQALGLQGSSISVVFYSTTNALSIIPATITANATVVVPDVYGTLLIDGSSYSNPSWLTSLAGSKLTGPVSATHIVGSTSTPTIAAGPAAGTSPTISITGTDLSGFITLTTGSSPADSAVLATITFNTAYSSAPNYVSISPASIKALAMTATYSPIPGDANGATTTTFTIITDNILVASTTYKFRYSVSQ